MTAKMRNFFKSFREERTISIKLPLRISVRSIPNTTKRTPKGMLKMKNSPKKATKRNKKWMNRS